MNARAYAGGRNTKHEYARMDITVQTFHTTIEFAAGAGRKVIECPILADQLIGDLDVVAGEQAYLVASSVIPGRYYVAIERDGQFFTSCQDSNAKSHENCIAFVQAYRRVMAKMVVA